MNLKLTLAFSLVAILCLGMAIQTYAQTRVPGVSNGDEMVYDVKAYWTSQNSSATVPPELQQMNSTGNFTVKVTIVSAPNVTTTQLWNFVNNTQQPYLVTWDIETGESYYYVQSPFEGIVGADLTAGDLLHPLGNDTITINQTITRSYADGEREINIVELTAPIVDSESNDANTIGTRRTAFYLDKVTGVLVEAQDEVEYFDNEETGSVIWMIKETNLWAVSNDNGNTSGDDNLSLPLHIIAGIIAVVIVVVIAIVVLRGRKKRKGFL
ncbi:MAG: hypothetical protein NWF04_02865 [Candidatus Bathyarchaeota archaeon]|nr:hypothetical protein [Candidatus Bathyarchaeota archaeon]